MIVNLSSRELTTNYRNLLSKGCKFTPYPKRNVTELQEDIIEFCRNLRIIEYFKDSPIQQTDLNLKYDRSNFVPPKGINADLDAIINLINKKTSDYIPKNNKIRYNLSRSEFRSMNELKEDSCLHITKADKGGAFVILDNDFYIQQMMKQHTSDTNIYRKIDKYAPHITIEKIVSLCKRHRSDCRFTKKELGYLTSFNYNLPILYGLPKIHKIDILIKI